MPPDPSGDNGLDEPTRAFYRQVVTALGDAGVPFLVGGAYAIERYTGIARHTKDFDVFVRSRDVDRTLAVLAGVGLRTEITFPHWLAKAFAGDEFVDVISGFGNGVAKVDDGWLARGVDAEVLGVPARLVPAEEMLWSKAFIMERERFDGADVAHLLRARAEQLDWSRLLERFGPHWRVLLAHLVLFGFVYPAERLRVPERVMRELLGRLTEELSAPPPREQLCRGTLLSWWDYLVDVERWGYRDARLRPEGALTEEELAEFVARARDGT